MANVGKYVFQQLESLSKREREELLENIKLFTTSKTSLRLTELVFGQAVKKKDEWTGPKGEDLENWLWKSLGKSGNSNTNTLSTYFNRLKDTLDQYFAFLHLRNSPLEVKLASIKAYSMRGASDLVTGQINSLRKSLDETDLVSYLRLIELALLEGEFLVEGFKRRRNRKFKDLINVLSEAQRFLNEAGEVGSTMLETMQVHASFLFNVSDLERDEKREQPGGPAPVLYRKLTRIIQVWRSNGRIPTLDTLPAMREIRISLMELESELSQKDAFQLNTMLISLLVPMINYGLEGARNEFFESLRYAHGKGYLVENGKMDAKTFKSLVEFSLENGDLEFAQEVIDEFGKPSSLHLRDDQGREDKVSLAALLNYIDAKLALTTGDYQKALKLANLGGLEDSLFVFAQRWLEIKACYYLKEYDRCIQRITAFEKVLRNNIRDQTYYHAEIYKLETAHLRRLIMALTETPQKRERNLKKLEEDVSTGIAYSRRGWILEEVRKALAHK